MSRVVKVINRSRGGIAVVAAARWCSTWTCRLRGLTFRRALPEGEGLLLVESGDGRLQTSIHMWAVFLDLGVVWIDSQGAVVDCRLARPWRVYVPKRPARYILEGRPEILRAVSVGEWMEFVDEDMP